MVYYNTVQRYYKINNLANFCAKKTLLRHEKGSCPYSVAKWLVCRNKWEKNLADFLELAENLLTFASEIVDFSFDSFFFIIGYLVSNVSIQGSQGCEPFCCIIVTNYVSAIQNSVSKMRSQGRAKNHLQDVWKICTFTRSNERGRGLVC